MGENSLFVQQVVERIKEVPFGQVATYGQIAASAGKPAGARQTAWILHSISEREQLPWHRIVSSGGHIRTKYPIRDLHRSMLIQEGVPFIGPYQVDLSVCRWKGQK